MSLRISAIRSTDALMRALHRTWWLQSKFRSFRSARGSENLALLFAYGRLRHIKKDPRHGLRAAVCALDEHDGNELIIRINPTLCSERSAVSVAANGMAGQLAHRISDD